MTSKAIGDQGTRNMQLPVQRKICMFAPFINTESTSNRPLFVSKTLVEFGDIDIVTTNFDHQTKANKSAFQFDDRRRIYYLPTRRYRENVSVARFLSHLQFSVRAWCFFLRRRKAYDVIYITLPFNLLAVLVFVSARKQLKIVDVVDIWPDVLPFSSRVKGALFPLFRIWKKLFALAVSNSDLLLTVSDTFLDESVRFFRGDRNAAKRFYIGSTRLPRANREPDDRLTIAYVGNIGYLYDFETLVSAVGASKLRPRLVLVGEGDRRRWLLRKLERAKIEYRFEGAIYDERRLAEALSSCHMGFNGIRNTSAAFSYKANTYFAAGLPILNSMTGDLGMLVATHGLGVNYKAGNVTSLAACIENCTPEALLTLSQNVKQFFDAEIDQEKIGEDLCRFVRPFLMNESKCCDSEPTSTS